MIVYDKETQSYHESDRERGEGPIIYIDSDITSINQVNHSNLSDHLKNRLIKMIRIKNESGKQCFSAKDLAQLFNLKFNATRPISHTLKKNGACFIAERFIHDTSPLTKLYIVAEPSNNSSKQAIVQNLTEIKSNDLLVIGNSDPKSTPTRFVNERDLVQEIYKGIPPNSSNFKSILPANNQYLSDHQFKRYHNDDFVTIISRNNDDIDIARPENLRFLYVIINLTINYFECNRQDFITKDKVESSCSIDMKQVLTWLMASNTHHWKQYVDDNLEIWANTVFHTFAPINGEYIATNEPLFKISARLVSKPDAKYARIYKLAWDPRILKVILDQKKPYLIPWSIMAGSDFTFVIYMEARTKWPGKAAKQQKVKFEPQQLMDLFPTMISKDIQVPKTSEAFSHFVVSELYTHAKRFETYKKSAPENKITSKDVVTFYNREDNEVPIDTKGFLSKKHLIQRIKAYLGGILFQFYIDGTGQKKQTYLSISYSSQDVILSSLPFYIRNKVVNKGQIDKKELNSFGYMDVSPKMFSDDIIANNVHKIIGPSFNITTMVQDTSINDLPIDVISEIIEDRTNSELSASGPILDSHLTDVLEPVLSDTPPTVDSKGVRNLSAIQFSLQKLPTKVNVPKTNLCIRINKTDFKEILTWYSSEKRIEEIVSKTMAATGDYEERISTRIRAALVELNPLVIGDFTIEREHMNNMFEALNSHLSDDLKLVELDDLFEILTVNKRHITRYSQSVSPVDDPVAFTSLFKHYVK